MSGGHQHGGGHGHRPPPARHRRPLAVVLGITGTILAVEVAGAFISGSLALCLAGHFDFEHSTVQFEPASHAGHEHPVHA
jgi:Co/Zn/Cd efflux system component